MKADVQGNRTPADDAGADNGRAADSPRPRGRGRRGPLILRATHPLPALFTTLNALAGFGAIHFATKDALGAAGAGATANLAVAGWLIFGAMVCDMLDGRLARMTRRTSDFGAQLDSLADMISFGAAPAVLMLRSVAMVVRGGIDRISSLPTFPAVERVVWVAAAGYVACAALRLARFNVENDPDESGHMRFKGLPTPGAAAAVTALVMLFADLAAAEQGLRASPWLLTVVAVTLPVVTLLAAVLMVSRFDYPHLINRYIRGRRSFGYLVRMVAVGLLVLMAGLFEVWITAAVLTLGYALSGPLRALWRRRPSATREA